MEAVSRSRAHRNKLCRSTSAREHADWKAVDNAMRQAASIARHVASYRHAKLSAIRLAGEIKHERRHQPKPMGERRHVTVMFCDLVDSTGIASKLERATVASDAELNFDGGVGLSLPP